nr:reverse transcriptase domain-containing protein [Tanacetum cinerariifolium]
MGDHRKLQLNELNELRNQAYENSLIYKERTKKLHDDKIKNRIFNVGDQVLLFNSRLKIFSSKLKSCWSGPFTISKIYPYRTAKLIHPDGCNFKVNCHRLKHYHGGDPPPLEIPDDYPPMVEDFLCRILSWFPRPSSWEMTFFLGLQVNQSPCGIFINQSKYVLEILNKYGMESCDPVGTPMEIKDKLDLDQNGTPVDATKYRSMIGSLMYLTSSRPDIVHATC